MTSSVNETLDSLETDKEARVTTESVEKAIKELPTGKSGSVDGNVYKHFRHGNDIISPILANLFIYMLRLSYIPDNMKRG